MKLFDRNRNQNVPTDLEPYTTGANDWRVWVRRIVAVVVLVALLAAVVWAGVKVYNSVTDDETATTKPTSQPAKESKDNSTSQSEPKDTQNNTDAKPGQNTQTPPASSAPLPRTGDDATTQPAVLPSTGG